jgi:hypothetical protein
MNTRTLFPGKRLLGFLPSILLTIVSLVAMIACSEGDSYDAAGGTLGQGGSMARFTICGDYMYTVDDRTLKLFDLSEPAQPEYLERKDQSLGTGGIETIFSMDTLLFIGSQDGMYIYDVTRPEFPQRLSHVSHIHSCDPVVALGRYAYVTLNSENIRCGSIANELHIYDISDLHNPELKVSETLNYPKGLGIDGHKLFVCDAKLGIKVYDVSNPLTPLWIDDLSYVPETGNIVPYDVIPMDGILLASTDQGLYQFDYTGEKLQFVSKITTVKE